MSLFQNHYFLRSFTADEQCNQLNTHMNFRCWCRHFDVLLWMDLMENDKRHKRKASLKKHVDSWKLPEIDLSSEWNEWMPFVSSLHFIELPLTIFFHFSLPFLLFFCICYVINEFVLVACVFNLLIWTEIRVRFSNIDKVNWKEKIKRKKRNRKFRKAFSSFAIESFEISYAQNGSIFPMDRKSFQSHK